MDLENMTLLVEVADELERLDEAISFFNEAGFSDEFDKLNCVYEVIKNYSIFKGLYQDEEESAFEDVLKNKKISAEKRAMTLLGIE